MNMISALKKEFDVVRRQITDPGSTKELVILGVTITLGVVLGVVVVVILAGLLIWGLYELVQMIKGKGPTATPTTLNISHDNAVIANSAGKTITASLTRQVDGNPMPMIDIRFEILPGTAPGITSNINGAAVFTGTTDANGNASVTITGTAPGADVCSIRLALGGQAVVVPYETAP